MIITMRIQIIFVGSILGIAVSNHSETKITAPGSQVTFPCDLKNNVLYWMWRPRCVNNSKSLHLIYTTRKGSDIIQLERFMGRLKVIFNEASGFYTLLLSDVVVSDSGKFSCTDEKREGTNNNLKVSAEINTSYEVLQYLDVIPCKEAVKSCYRNVQLKAEWNNNEPRIGNSLRMTCSLCSNESNSNTTFFWFFDGKPIEGSPDITIKNQAVTIENVHDKHQGIWSCGYLKNASSTSEYCLSINHEESGNKRSTLKVVSSPALWSLILGQYLLITLIVSSLFIFSVILTIGIWFYRSIKIEG